MCETVVYEIARYDGSEDVAELIDRIQLVSIDGTLRLRGASGDETLCTGDDVAAVISSTPALREIREGQEARITCVPEILGRLPFVLEPLMEGDDTENLSATVNGEQWSAFPTDDGDFAMLPGWDPLDGPSMDLCWAEFQVEEGENNPLIGWTSIGLAMQGVVVEYARYDHGGFGSESAIKIKRFDDFATVFVDWLLNIEVLCGLWGGDSSPYSPSAELFEAAAAAADRKASWSTEEGDDDDPDEDEEDEEVDYEVDNSCWTSLELHLTDSLVEEVRGRLKKSGVRPS
ncbi:MAG: hypothetical protein ACKOI2_05820 [Actinomycetota bacterium]